MGLSDKFFETENLGDDLNQKTFGSLFYIFKNWWFYFWEWICYAPNYQIILDRVNNSDTFDINIEMNPDDFPDSPKAITGKEKKLQDAMKAMLGINPKIHLVAPKSIERSEGKAVRLIDKRKRYGITI